jgi:YD repeat-containing protein
VHSTREYKIQPRKHHRGVGLFSDVLPFGHLWYGEPKAVSNAIAYTKHRSRSRHAVIRAYDTAGNVIETHDQRGRIQRGGAQHLY